MPVSIESDAWQNGEEAPRLSQTILDFLESNPGQAFHKREIADEVIGTDWDALHESDRLQEKLDEEEFEKRLHDGDLPDSDVSHQFAESQVIRLDHHLSKLVDEGKVEMRQVDAAPLDFPYDWETAVVFAYDGD